ncbi:phosphatase PAP2 family protein [Variovorax sp. LT1R16]|uniref:phosphatase PAP2 family protein n=1 Tax=Variovorax sp. LT1R16 TaxID=3443728 RepID=UPI003F488158
MSLRTSALSSLIPRVLAATLAGLLLVLLWDASGLDLPLARLAGGPDGFALRDNTAFVLFFHEVPRLLSWACLTGLFAAIRWPCGPLRCLTRGERVQLALTVLGSVLAVSLLKHASHTSCPWDLRDFGGKAVHLSHWAWGLNDGGPGGCFPAGHASAALAYIGGWFVWRRHLPRAAMYWLAASLGLGLVLGIAQQWRGAHYMSHTLWTAWVCWAVGWLADGLAHARWQTHEVPPKLNET